MELFGKEMLWFGDEEQGLYFAIVVAPDEKTANRMIGRQMLRDHTDIEEEAEALADEGCKTFLDFYEQHQEMSHIGDIGGTACPNCTSHVGRDTGKIAFIPEGWRKIHECSSCGYQWIPLGFGPKRAEMEAAATSEIAEMDAIEAKIRKESE